MKWRRKYSILMREMLRTSNTDVLWLPSKAEQTLLLMPSSRIILTKKYIQHKYVYGSGCKKLVFVIMPFVSCPHVFRVLCDWWWLLLLENSIVAIK